MIRINNNNNNNNSPASRISSVNVIKSAILSLCLPLIVRYVTFRCSVFRNIL